MYNLSQLPNIRLPKQFIRYCIIGGIGAIIHYSVLILLTELVGIHYLMSAWGAIACAVCFNFTGNKFWTFKQQLKN